MNQQLSSRRLPGFRFETQAASPPDVLPRMDIAAFVGFAGSGPLHHPVAIESSAQFEMIFGPDLPLASTPSGSPTHAHLAPAVRDFFRQGGRRCWIIRVAASHAVTSAFPLPGVVSPSGPSFQPAFAHARSPGSGFDATQIATSVRSRPIEVVDASQLATLVLRVHPTATLPLLPGETLRLTYRSEGIEALGTIASVQPLPSSLPGYRSDVSDITFHSLAWFAWPATQSPSPLPGTGSAWPTPGSPRTLSATALSQPDDASPSSAPEWPGRLEDRNVRFALSLDVSEVPPIGTLLSLALPNGILLLRVDAVSGASESLSPPSTSVIVEGEARWALPSAPTPLPAATLTAERLSFDLRARSGPGAALVLSDLAFAPDHPRCWTRLPPDALLYPDPETAPATGRVPDAFEPYSDLWRDAALPRFPIAGPTADPTHFLPVLMRPLPDQWLAAAPSETSPLVRDGLDAFSAALFLDPDLVEPLIPHLAQEADFLRFESRDARSLLGIHATLGIEEATLLAVPDAVHPGWAPRPAPPDSPGTPPSSEPPEWGRFLPCGLRILPAPELFLAEGPDSEGTSRLTWTHSDPAADSIEVMESALASLADASPVYRGPGSALSLYRRAPGTYYYVARSLHEGQAGAWSAVLTVHVATAQRWQVSEWTDAARDSLLALHRSILRLCAARGDLLGILALPEAWRASEALDHLASLRSLQGAALDVAGRPCLPLGAGEAAAFSYAAVYHPWLVHSRSDGSLRRIPPDGALTGVIAHRSLTRGAWIAPANVTLAETLALEPVLDRDAWQDLQDAQINFLRQDAYGFRCLAADTLSADPELRAINVRRLLQLLRRLALRHGATYTFEPLSDAFQRTVQHAFESILLHLFARGAFAGKSPSTSFQVNTGPSVNPPASRELGRFIVEIKVAPALPLRFLTLRLVQTGDRAEVSESR